MSEEVNELDLNREEFIALLSHKLRTPLSIVKGYLEMMIDGDTGDVNDMQRECLASMMQSTDKIIHYIGELCDKVNA